MWVAWFKLFSSISLKGMHSNSTTKKIQIKKHKRRSFSSIPMQIINDTYSRCMNSKNASVTVNIFESGDRFDLVKFIYEGICRKYTTVQALIWVPMQIQNSFLCCKNLNNQIKACGHDTALLVTTSLNWLP